MMRNLLFVALASTGYMAYGISFSKIKECAGMRAPDTPSPAAEIESVDAKKEYKDSDIAVSVNDHTMTWKELNDKVETALKKIYAHHPVPEEHLSITRHAFRAQVLNQYITVCMFTDEAKRLNITVSDETRAEAIKKISDWNPGKTIEEIFEEHPLGSDAARKDFEDQLLVEEVIKKQAPGTIEIPDDEMKRLLEEAAVKAGEANQKFADAEKLLAGGMPFEEVVKDFSTTPIEVKIPKDQAKMIDPAFAEILETLEPGQISERFETRNWLARVKLIKTIPAIDKTSAKATIKEIREKLLKGGDFAALAAEFSVCPSGKNGGELGTFGRGQMVAEFEQAAFGQEVGVIGPIIETEFGYHIVKVTGKTESDTPAEDTVTASHILIAEAPESVVVYLLFVSAEPVLSADMLREEMIARKKEKVIQAFRSEFLKRAKVTCVYPELLQ